MGKNDDSGLFPIGNRNPGKRGLDKEIKRASANRRAGKKKGCPLAAVLFLAWCVSAVTAGWFTASALDYWIS